MCRQYMTCYAVGRVLETEDKFLLYKKLAL